MAIALWVGTAAMARPAHADARPVASTQANVDPATQPATTQPAAAPARGNPGSDLTSLSLEDLMSMEVTSVSKHRQRIAEAPAAITDITQDDIARSGLHSIPELLRLSPGLDVARIDASQWAVSARGFNDLFGNKLLVMMDGRTLYSPLFSGVFWDMQDYVLQDLDRIEVIRGPGATLWGSNAVNGVINIESKSARDTQGWLLDGVGGTDLDSASVRFGGKIDDDTYFRVFTRYRHYNDQPLGGPGDADDGWQSVLGGVRIDRYASDRDQLTFEASGYGSRNAQALLYPDLAGARSRQVVDSAFNAGEAYALGRWTHTFSETADLALQLYFDHLNRSVWQNNRYALDTLDLDFQNRFGFVAGQEITWGLGGRFTADDVKGSVLPPNPPSFVLPQRRDDFFVSAFIQDDVSIIPERLHLIPGTKLEQNSYSGFEVEPSAKLLWTPNDRNTVWGSVARAVRTPSRWELDATVSGAVVPTGTPLPGVSQSEGNPHFQSEELAAYELGYRVRPARGLSLDVSGFFNHYDRLQGFVADAPSLQPGPPPYLLLPVSVANDLYGHSYGAELAAKWNVTDAWRVSASYTWLQLHIMASRPDPLGQAAFDNGSSPHNQFQIHSSWDVTRNLQLNASAYVVEALGIGVPSYVRVDLNTTWHVRDGMDLTAGVQNLLDDRHPEFGGFRVINVTSEVPRTFFGELTWRF